MCPSPQHKSWDTLTALKKKAGLHSGPGLKSEMLSLGCRCLPTWRLGGFRLATKRFRLAHPAIPLNTPVKTFQFVVNCANVDVVPIGYLPEIEHAGPFEEALQPWTYT